MNREFEVMTGCEENGAPIARWAPVWRRGMSVPKSGAPLSPLSDRSLSDLECGENPAKREPHRFPPVLCPGWAKRIRTRPESFGGMDRNQQGSARCGACANLYGGVWGWKRIGSFEVMMECGVQLGIVIPAGRRESRCRRPSLRAEAYRAAKAQNLRNHRRTWSRPHQRPQMPGPPRFLNCFFVTEECRNTSPLRTAREGRIRF